MIFIFIYFNCTNHTFKFYEIKPNIYYILNSMDPIFHTERTFCIIYSLSSMYKCNLIITIRKHTGDKPKYFIVCKYITLPGYKEVNYTGGLQFQCVCFDFRFESKSCDFKYLFNGAKVAYHIMPFSCMECDNNLRIVIKVGGCPESSFFVAHSI